MCCIGKWKGRQHCRENCSKLSRPRSVVYLYLDHNSGVVRAWPWETLFLFVDVLHAHVLLQRDADLGREKVEADKAEADSNAKRTKQGLERKITKLEGQLAHAASQLDERGQHLIAELRQARLQADLSARSQR